MGYCIYQATAILIDLKGMKNQLKLTVGFLFEPFTNAKSGTSIFFGGGQRITD
jgi:hypothetical protein